MEEGTATTPVSRPTPLSDAWEAMRGLGGGATRPVYLAVYEELLSRLRRKMVRVLQLGPGDGEALLLSREYFTRDDAAIVGLGNDAMERELPDGVDVVRGEVTDPERAAMVDTSDRPFDLVIDATARPWRAQGEVFGIWAPYLSSRG